MMIEARIPVVEDILGTWRHALGPDYPGYKNHVYRMIHFCLALRACTDDERQKIFIAGGFHDLGIWSSGTIDYLPPSIDLAAGYLQKNNLEPWIPEIELMIALHHTCRQYTDDRYPLVEVFRRGDMVDFSLGLIKWGLPASCVKSVQARFPNAGFHRRLARLAAAWFLKHPLAVPPFIKW